MFDLVSLRALAERERVAAAKPAPKPLDAQERDAWRRRGEAYARRLLPALGGRDLLTTVAETQRDLDVVDGAALVRVFDHLGVAARDDERVRAFLAGVMSATFAAGGLGLGSVSLNQVAAHRHAGRGHADVVTKKS